MTAISMLRLRSWLRFRVLLALFFIFLPNLLMAQDANLIAEDSHVSLIKLSADPERFEERRLMLSGYLSAENGEQARLYLNEEAFLLNSPDYVGLDFRGGSEDVYRTALTLNGSYAVLSGVFQYTKFNSPLESIGYIDLINRIAPKRRQPK